MGSAACMCPREIYHTVTEQWMSLTRLLFVTTSPDISLGESNLQIDVID